MYNKQYYFGYLRIEHDSYIITIPPKNYGLRSGAIALFYFVDKSSLRCIVANAN